jgi:hypothetical protein
MPEHSPVEMMMGSGAGERSKKIEHMGGFSLPLLQPFGKVRFFIITISAGRLWVDWHCLIGHRIRTVYFIQYTGVLLETIGGIVSPTFFLWTEIPVKKKKPHR